MNILLLVDVRGWAWDIKAHEIKNNLPQHNITIKLGSEFSKSDLGKYDAIHSFDWHFTAYVGITSAISSHNYYLINNNFSDVVEYLNNFSAITCVSKELYDKTTVESINKNIYLCCNGVNEEIFYPKEKKESTKFVVGWVGQKTRGNFKKKPIDIKGYEHILNPLKKKLSKYSDIIVLENSNNYTNATIHTEMVKLYHQFDVLISTSFLEGTPNPVFEAAACGLPIISTKVGCVPELLNSDSNGLLINCYKNESDANNVVNSFLEKILFLKKNRDICKKIGEENRKEIENKWTWKERAKQWLPVFENHRINQNNIEEL